MYLVVLAGGRSTRFGSSKQTTPVGPQGQWLLDYALQDAARAGFTTATVVVAAGNEALYEGRFAGRADGLAVHVVPQRTGLMPPALEDAPRDAPWGTAHAVLSARRIVGDQPFAVVNADDYYGAAAYRLAARALDHAATSGEATIVGMRLADTLSPHGPVTRAICQVGPDGCVQSLEEVRGITFRDRNLSSEQGPVDGDALVSMNCWALPAAAMQMLEEAFVAFVDEPGAGGRECLLPSVLSACARSGRLTIRIVTSPGPWFGLTHPGDLAWVRDGLGRVESL